MVRTRGSVGTRPVVAAVAINGVQRALPAQRALHDLGGQRLVARVAQPPAASRPTRWAGPGRGPRWPRAPGRPRRGPARSWGREALADRGRVAGHELADRHRPASFGLDPQQRQRACRPRRRRAGRRGRRARSCRAWRRGCSAAGRLSSTMSRAPFSVVEAWGHGCSPRIRLWRASAGCDQSSVPSALVSLRRVGGQRLVLRRFRRTCRPPADRRPRPAAARRACERSASTASLVSFAADRAAGAWRTRRRRRAAVRRA